MKQLIIIFICALGLLACNNDNDDVVQPMTPVAPAPAPDTTAPSLDSIADIDIPADSSDNSIGVTVSDDTSTGGDISVNAVSSNQAVVSSEGITFSNDTLLVTPVADSVGTTTVTLTATDAAGNSSSISFEVNVTENPTSAREFVRTVFAAPANGAPLPINGIALIQDVENADEFDDLLE